MRRIPVALFTLVLAVIFLIGLIPMWGTPSPEGDWNEQRWWARELHQEWTGSGASEAAQASIVLLEGASLACTRDALERDLEPSWGHQDTPESITRRYITYSVGCPELAAQYEAWLDETNNWPAEQDP